MSDGLPNPLQYHYDTKSKLDYFILSIDVAFLGWTLINTAWLPEQKLFIVGMALCWGLVILSIVCGIINQNLLVRMFGINHLILEMSKTASAGEQGLMQNATFMQPSGSAVPHDEVRASVDVYRKAEAEGKKMFDVAGWYAKYLTYASPILLTVALCLLGVMKIWAMFLLLQL